MSELQKPPHANRGVVMLKEEKEKVENPLVSMVDYIRVTFKTHDVDHIIENVLDNVVNIMSFESHTNVINH